MPTKVTSTLINTISSSQIVTAVKNIVGPSYTLQNSDANCIIRYNSSSDVILDIPAGIMSNGDHVMLVQIGAGNIITAANNGVNVIASGQATQTFQQYSVASLIQTATNEWLLVGDIA